MSTSTVIYTLVGVDRASGAFRSAGMSADRTASKLGMLGKAAGLAVGAIAAAATAVAVESVKSAVAFQGAMEKIHTQAGASQASVDSLTKSVLKLAPATQQGPQELAAALYHLKSLGMDNAAAMKALAQSSNLAAVGGANIEDTATAIGAAWRSGIKGGQSFSKVAATVNAIIGAGNMRMEDFVQSLSSGILPAARTFGVGLNSIGAALALMTDEGIPAVDAATRLRMSLSLLGAPSATANKALQTIGLTGTELGEAMRGPQGIIGAISLLSDHLKKSGLDATQQAQVISKAFGGGRSSSAIMTMLNNLSVLERKQRQINATTGNYGAAVAAQRKTAQAQFALLRSSLDTLGIRIGLALLPPVTKFVTFLAKTAVPDVEKFAGKVMGLLPVHAIEQEADRIKATILGLLGIHQHAKPRPVRLPVNVAGLRPQQFDALMTRMGARKPLAIPVTITGLKVQQLNAVLGKSFTALAGSPPPAGIGQWITAALRKVAWGKVLAQALQGAVSGATQIGAAFLTLLSKVNWNALGQQMASALVGLVVSIVNNLGGALISETVHHPLDVVAFVAALIPAGKIADGILAVFGEVKFLGPLLKFLLTPISKAGDVVASALGSVLKKIFGPIGDRMLSFFTGSDHWLAKAGLNIVQGFDLGLTKAWKVMVWPWLKKIPGLILDGFTKADSWLTGKGMQVIGGLLGGAEHALGPALDWLGGVGSKVIGVFAKAAGWLKGTGGSIIGGMLGGIRDAMSGIGSWVNKYIVQPLITWVKSWFGIHSPSTVMAGIGGHLMGGLFKGMMSGDLEGMVVKIFGSLPAALARIVEKGLVSVAELPVRGLQALGHGLDKLFGDSGFPGLPQLVGKAMAASMGWTGGQWTALDNLWNRESGWNPSARNPKSGAYGIPQALPASKMASAGADWLTNPETQIKWGLGYILGRYGSPAAAWAHEQKYSWYGHGGPFSAGQVIGVGDRGPELVQFSQAGRVLSPEQSAALIQSESARKIRSAYAAIGANITSAFAAGVNKTKQQAIDASHALTAQVAAAFAGGKITAAQDSSLLARIKTDLDTAERRIAALQARAMKTLHNLSLALSQGILTGLQGSASQVKSAAGKLVTAVKTVMDAGLISFPRATALTRFIGQDNAKLQALAKQRAKIAATIAAAENYASSVASNAASGAQLVNLPSVANGSITGGGIIADLGAQLTLIKRFGSDLRRLRTLGLSKALLSQVIAAGPEQGDQLAQALISSGAVGIAQANRAESAIGKASRAVGRSAANYMYDSGKQAGKGFLSGLKAQEAAISKVMTQIAKALVKTIKKELGIHSPSRVTFGIGEFTGIGIEEGMLSRVRHIEAAGSRLAHAAVPGQRRGGGMNPVPMIAAGAQGGDFTGTLYLDSGEFLGVVRGEIRQHDRKLLRAATTGAGLAG